MINKVRLKEFCDVAEITSLVAVKIQNGAKQSQGMVKLIALQKKILKKQMVNLIENQGGMANTMWHSIYYAIFDEKRKLWQCGENKAREMLEAEEKSGFAWRLKASGVRMSRILLLPGNKRGRFS